MICIWLVLLPAMLIPVSAEDDSMSFLFSLTANGKDTVEVETGDIITVVFQLDRTDANEQYMMYAMQNEIRYDSNFFELVEDSTILNREIMSTDIAMVDQYREFYMNYLSMGGGEMRNPSVVIGSIQLKVIAKSGITQVINQDYLVSRKNGIGSYTCTAKDLTVVLSTECTVTFESNGGTKVPDQIAQWGEKLDVPEDPVRERFTFDGWYKDIHLTEKWDFENDVVHGNMRLYAKWIEKIAEDQAGEIGMSCCWIWLLVLLLILISMYFLQKKIRKQRKQERK